MQHVKNSDRLQLHSYTFIAYRINTLIIIMCLDPNVMQLPVFQGAALTSAITSPSLEAMTEEAWPTHK